MAGAGYKLFVNGNTLSASDLNTYVQQQTVMVFASASARTTALASVLAEGMVSYRTDSHVFEIYNGSAWVSAGISSPLTTKGDLWGYDTAGNRIPVGSNNQVLTADSTQALGVKWATPASGGMTLLSTTTLSGTSTTISSISQSYTDLYIYIYGITGATNNGTLDIQPNSSGSITYQVCLQGAVTPTEFYASVLRCWSGFNGLSSDSNNAWYGVIRNYAGSTNKPFFGTGYFYNNSSVSKGVFQSGAILTTSAISSLQVGNGVGMNSGTCKIYGVN